MRSVFTLILLAGITWDSFAQEYLYHPFTTAVSAPNKVVSIDLDKDGDDDYVVASKLDNKLSWFENLGNYRTIQHVISTAVLGAVGLDVIDMDGDDDFDVITNASVLNEVMIFLNRGGQIFEKMSLPRVQVVDDIIASVAGDLDNDGDLDIFTVGSYQNAHYVNDGHMNFTTIADAGIEFAFVFDVKMHDMDLDGDLDLVTRGNQESIYIQENLGGNTFKNYSLGLHGSFRDFTIVDFNNDTLPDVIVTQPINSRIIAYINNGDWTFTRDTIINDYDGAPWGIVPTDMDVDGDIDFYVNTHNGSDGACDMVENIDGDSFVIHRIAYKLKDPVSLSLTRFNQDTLLDVVITDETKNYLTVMVRNPDLTFTEYPLSNSASPMTEYLSEYAQPLDLDLDGDVDILGRKVFLENARNGFFTQHSTSLLYHPSALDYDRDGDLDLLAPVNSDGKQVMLHTNDGDENFEFQTILWPLPQNTARQVHGIDINHDDHFDVFANSLSTGVNLFFHDGIDTFYHKSLEGESKSIVSNPVDVDEDGDIDVLVGNDQSISWYENIGSDTMIRHKTDLIPTLYGAQFVDFGDIDGDSDPDLTVSGTYQGANHLGWLENDGHLNFTEQHWISNTTRLYEQPRLFDKDNDGDLDILDYNVTSENLYWYENDGVGNFTPFIFGAQIKINNAQNAQAADFDNDNDIDLFANAGWYECLNNVSRITCIVFIDINENGQQDPNEHLFTNPIVSISPRNFYHQSTSPNLTFLLDMLGEYVLTFDTLAYQHYALTTPEADTVIINTQLSRDTVRFGVILKDLIYSSSDCVYAPVLRCGRNPIGGIIHCNDGTVNHTGILWVEVENATLSDQGIIAPDTIVVPNKFGWKLNDLLPEQCISIPMVLDQIPFTPGDTVRVTAYAVLDSAEFRITMDTFKFADVIRCAYDPNDKLGFPNRANRAIYPDECLSYQIRFQNVGNDAAEDVTLVDTLDTYLDVTTFQFLASSHTGQLTYTVDNNRVLHVKFENINLPDSLSNYDGSQGFFAYKICPSSNLPLDVSIHNTADIFFDFNPPIRTNTTEHILSQLTTNIKHHASDLKLTLFPVPTQELLHIGMHDDFNGEVKADIYTSLGSAHLYSKLNIEAGNTSVDVSELAAGIYFIVLHDGLKQWSGRFVKF